MTSFAGVVAGLERVSPTEAADIEEITRGMLAIQAQAAAAGKRPLARGTHAKGICVRGELEVLDVRRVTPDPALAERLVKGVFAVPGTYPATIRFANADGGHRQDRRPDVRALSFSIDVPPGIAAGKTRLDFSMNSATTFPINDAHAFAIAVRVIAAQGMRAKWKALRSLRRREFGSLLRTMRRGRQQQRGTPRKAYQQLRYWSTVPFLHGEREAVKYSAIPARDNSARPLQPGPNQLQDELVRHINEDERMSEFDLVVQFLDASRMTCRGRTQEPSFWVENAAVEWNEAESPFYVVARLRLMPKSVLPPAESEAFWIDVTENSTPETRPIGSINRARWHAESASRAARLRQPVAASTWTPANPRRRIVWGTIGLAALAFAATLGWALGPVAKDLPERLQYPPPPLGNNGLTVEERQRYYHLSEGGEAYPIAWLLALEQEIRGPDGRVTYRPFLENVERFGFLPDPPSRYNPYGLPVGVTAGYGKITGQQMMGLNCSACHVAELHSNGRAFRIDGGPSMAHINAFIKAIVDETSATAESWQRRRRFLDRWRRVQLVRLLDNPVVPQAAIGSTPSPGDEETLDGGEPGVFRRVLSGLRMAIANRSLLMDKLHGFAAVTLVVQAQPLGTEEGYGRNDAFGVGRNELFGAYKDANFTQGINVLPADAPVSFPHLWGMERTAWFQWGVNTNSVIERNIGQALGVGATMQPDKGFSSTVRLDNLYAMERLQYKLTSPEWPAGLFGSIDGARAERGRKMFDRTCALCHETYTKTGTLNEYQLFPLDVVGTDPSTALNFERTVMTAEGPKPFGTAAFEIVGRVKEAYYREHQTPPDVQARWEARATRPAAAYRTPLLDYLKYPDTRSRGIYRAKTLKGIWATAPYLHNGSVPSVYDLLLPADQRPTTFKLGTKEYDPAKLGYVVDGSRFVTPPGMTPFTFDTRLLGNWNTGHEWWFYPDLDDDIRYDIIEFLKTFDDVNYPGDYRFERPARLPDNVRMDKRLPIAQAAYAK